MTSVDKLSPDGSNKHELSLTHPRLVACHVLFLAGLRGVAVVVELALLEVPQNLLAVDGVEKVFGRELLLKSEQIF